MDDDEFADLLSRPPASSTLSSGLGGFNDNPWGASDALDANPFADLSSSTAALPGAGTGTAGLPASTPFGSTASPFGGRGHAEEEQRPQRSPSPVRSSPPSFNYGVVQSSAPSSPARNDTESALPPLQLQADDDEEIKPLRQMMPKAKAAAKPGNVKPTGVAAKAPEPVSPVKVEEKSPAVETPVEQTAVKADTEEFSEVAVAKEPEPVVVEDKPAAPSPVPEKEPETAPARAEEPEKEGALVIEEHLAVPASPAVSDEGKAPTPTVSPPASPKLTPESKTSLLVEDALPPADGALDRTNEDHAEPTATITTSAAAATPEPPVAKEPEASIPNPLAPPPEPKPAPKPVSKAAAAFARGGLPPGMGPAVGNPLSAAPKSSGTAVFDPLGAAGPAVAPKVDAKPNAAATNGPLGPLGGPTAAVSATATATAPATATTVPSKPAPTPVAPTGPQPLIPANLFGNVVNPLASSVPPRKVDPVTKIEPVFPAATTAASGAPTSPKPATPVAPESTASVADPLAAAPVPKPAEEPKASAEVNGQSAAASPVAAPAPSPQPAAPAPSVAPVLEVPKVMPKFEISVGEPVRVGGMDAHTSYRIRTKTTSTQFRNPDVTVNRRYRDFLWLWNQLSISHPGVILPPIPEKQTMGRFQEDFVESRRMGLERFLQKVVSHPGLFDDPDIKVFLESETFSADASVLTKKDPSKASAGMFSAFSMSNVTQFRATPDKDEQLDTKKMEIDKFESQLKQLLKGVEALVKQRKELGAATAEMGEALLALGGAEPDAGLSKKLKAVGNVSKKIKDLQDKQADNDVSSLAFSVDMYIRYCASVDQAYQSRTRYWNMVKAAENNVMNKRVALDKARNAGKKGDKLTALQTEIDEAENGLKQAQRDFADVSTRLRYELERFDRYKVADLSASLQTFLESLLLTQKEIVLTWESYFAESQTDAQKV